MTTGSRRMARLCAAGLVAMASGIGAPADERATATSKGSARVYVTRSLRGFTVRVDERLLGERRELGDEALAVLDAQLLAIARRVRDAPLAQLRTIPIWLGLDDPVAPCACYHPSAEWLRGNGFDPQKAKAVEIAHAEAFVQWTHEQPWMVLHELAHGFDDRRLDPRGDGEAAALGRELEELLARAKAGGRYDSVLHWDGGHVAHYALGNSEEYFAEASEAWLGTNDFFPFVAAELREFDPALAAFLARVWGEPVDSAHPR